MDREIHYFWNWFDCFMKILMNAVYYPKTWVSCFWKWNFSIIRSVRLVDWSVGASVGVSVIISSFTSFHALIGALVYFIACTNSFTLLLYTVSSGKYYGDLWLLYVITSGSFCGCLFFAVMFILTSVCGDHSNNIKTFCCEQ